MQAYWAIGIDKTAYNLDQLYQFFSEQAIIAAIN